MENSAQQGMCSDSSDTSIMNQGSIKLVACNANTSEIEKTKYFSYDAPLAEETGFWIPVSVPPLSESDHEEWARGCPSNGGYYKETGNWFGQERDLTMWDVVVELLLAGQGKVVTLVPSDSKSFNVKSISTQLLEQAWKEIALTLTETNLSMVNEILETEPPKWLPDSSASACMLCGVRFHPIVCSRHHCRFCGGVFCGDCTTGRSLLPLRFRCSDPKRVCDVCCVRLESVKPHLMDQVSRAAQSPTHDVTDLSTLRSWLNFPWADSMEYEIYKAANTIRAYCSKVGALKVEKRIPNIILKQAKGLAIVTAVKVGVGISYSIGTGLVVTRREDGSWSPPSAMSSFGVGWGAQVGGELTDFIIVLKTAEALSTFSGCGHLSVSAGLSAAIGTSGRTVAADLRAGDGGYSACYSYSCSKGAFMGCSLDGNLFTTRTRKNSEFYGSQFISAADILLGTLPSPPAASILYQALADLYQKHDI